jgi:hypothetical protein
VSIRLADVDVHLERLAHEISDGNSTSVMVLIVSSYEFAPQVFVTDKAGPRRMQVSSTVATTDDQILSFATPNVPQCRHHQWLAWQMVLLRVWCHWAVSLVRSLAVV